MVVLQHTTGKKFNPIEATAEDWIDQMPVKVIGEFFVSEGVGTIDGCIACFWIGDRHIDDPETIQCIQQYIDDQDVVGLRFIRARPTEVHPSILHALDSSTSSAVNVMSS